MKALIAVSEKNGIDSKIDPRFGRAGYFMIYDLENDSIIDVYENQFRVAEHGVGIKTAGHAIENGCSLIIGAQPGPKAERVLKEGGVEIFTATSGTAGEAVENYKKSMPSA